MGGLGKGGRGVYALDMTTPNVGSEIVAANKVLWEFPNATTNATVKANVGYVFGRPFIVKTQAKGWVVLVASGYNNGTGTDNSGGDGHSYLFVLNARTGALIKAIDTTVGAAADPSGMAHLAAYVVDADYNPTVSQVYAGDLKGNVWRFDLTDLSIANWGVKRLAILRDGPLTTDNTQPVTTEPQFADIKINGVFRRLVYVGTGRYLGDSDVPTTGVETLPGSQKQTVYGLVDVLSDSSPAGGGHGDYAGDRRQRAQLPAGTNVRDLRIDSYDSDCAGQTIRPKKAGTSTFRIRVRCRVNASAPIRRWFPVR